MCKPGPQIAVCKQCRRVNYKIPSPSKLATGCASQVDHLSPARCGLAWSPDGSMVAVPGHEHDVVCYERLNWKPLLTLRGGHTARVNLVAFSPDGALQSLAALQHARTDADPARSAEQTLGDSA